MLSCFQLRAGRALLKLTINDLATEINVHSRTLALLETTPNLSYLKCNLRTATLLVKLFKDRGVEFSSFNSISLLYPTQKNGENNLNTFQFIVSKVATRLSRKSFANIIGLPESAIRRFDSNQNWYEEIRYDTTKIKSAKKTIESLGISFPSPFTVTLLEDPDKTP